MPSGPDQRPKAAVPGRSPGLSDDAFLGGRLHILQPVKGFRAGLDAVMLAAAVPARERQSICDLGSGVGTAGLCVASRVAAVQVTAVDIDSQALSRATENAQRNGLGASFTTIEADLQGRARNLPRQHFHHVLTNPPFHDTARGTRAPDSAKASASSIAGPALFHWLRLARAIVRPRGTVSAILPPAQLALAISALSEEGQGITLIPLWPAKDVPAKRLIVRAQMNSRAPSQLLAGVILHEADGRPTPEAEAILRHAGALST
jgi:tRNA1(Val) A37 N6-methylase TrmN6